MSAGSCCQSAAPFCAFAECVDCRVGNDVYTYNQARCHIGSLNACRIGADAECCLGAGGGATCAANWFLGSGPAFKIVGTGFPDSKKTFGRNVNQSPPLDCGAVVEPNHYRFMDSNGARHDIYLPKGTFQSAVAYVMNGNLDELIKFPVWADQHYAADDCVRVKNEDTVIEK
ncbi:uncharacterized protein G6M90_00g111660 [Metarhizium brunneum]|uniref:Uncharacterized protein n=1 Tax=Metarhizium brunneum TaxID=500148 RepID=A0A7D5YZG5_9HYPO